jgi:predicted nucleic acid-binding protein
VADAGGLCYVETSALLSALLEQDATAKRSLSSADTRVTSTLTVTEARRAIIRARRSERLTSAQERAVTHGLEGFIKHCDLVAITDDVLLRAGRPFAVEPIRTLDAIHLATLELLGEAPALVTVLTRDSRVRDNAVAAGFAVE